jgi:rRNA-processing protein FCF1
MNDSPESITALFDGNVLDWLVERPADLTAIQQSLQDGRLRLIHTHLLRDEPDATPDPEKRAKLAAVREQLAGEYVATTGFVLDVSRLDEAKLFSDEGARRFNEELTTEDPNTGGRRHAEDALLALTAEDEGAVLVTRDVNLTKRARRQGIDVTTPADLIARLSEPHPGH